MEASENPASQSAPSGGMARLFLLLQASLRPVEGILIRMISCLTAASTTWRSTPLAGFLLTHMGHFSSPFQELARTATPGRSTSTEKVVITGRAVEARYAGYRTQKQEGSSCRAKSQPA